jgi:MarR family 2-MHQ and catechol resistance regulon transcriptional repressor
MEALHHKGDMLLGELQDKILVTSGGVTYLVDRLVEKGMVERRECTEDRRARYAALTARGKALMRRIFPEHAEWLETALGGLTIGEQKEAATLLKQLGTHASSTVPGAG